MSRSKSLDLADFRDAPIVQIDTDNYRQIWPNLIDAVSSATFVALDTELSGLGNRKKLNSKDLEDRYQAIVKTARTHAVISIGLSCYRLKKEYEDNESNLHATAVQFEVETFNVLVLCQDVYAVEPESVKFLSDHGFDFNRQCSHGLPYKRGHDKNELPEFSLRRLFAELIIAGPPIVFHNAIIDLIFLYESFYTSLPSTLSAFVADLSEMFPAGIYDTKYISEFITRTSRSYLEYLFRRKQRDNSASASRNKPFTCLVFPTYDPSMNPHVVMSPCGLTDQPCERDVGKTVVCAQYDAHGWCGSGLECKKSHDMDLILDAEDWVISGGSKKILSKKSIDMSTSLAANTVCEPSIASLSVAATGNPSAITNAGVENKVRSTDSRPAVVDTNRVAGHSAGFDAFMTGYVFASYVTRNPSLLSDVPQLGERRTVIRPVNNIYLCGKDFPMKVERSSYSKSSKGHRETYRNIQQSLKFRSAVSESKVS